ncbi:hypothetical protein D3C85_1613820 [compost metagenome]
MLVDLADLEVVGLAEGQGVGDRAEYPGVVDQYRDWTERRFGLGHDIRPGTGASDVVLEEQCVAAKFLGQ